MTNSLYQSLRAQARENNSRFAESTGGNNYMKSRLYITEVLDNGSQKRVIDESSIFDTICKVGRKEGFDKIASSSIQVRKGNFYYKFVRKATNSDYYRKDTSGYYVLSRISVSSIAKALNNLFDELGSKLVAHIESR